MGSLERGFVNPWLETVGVILLAFLGAALGRICSRLPRRWWLLGYLVPLAIICMVGLPRLDRGLEFQPPICWFVSGRTLFAIAGFVTTMILVTPLSRLPKPRERRMVGLFAGVFVIYSSVWPFFAPVLNHRFEASFITRFDRNGICEQSTDYNCGPAAAVTALTKLGFLAQEGEIAIMAHTSNAIGTPPDVLCRALQKHYALVIRLPSIPFDVRCSAFDVRCSRSRFEVQQFKVSPSSSSSSILGYRLLSIGYSLAFLSNAQVLLVLVIDPSLSAP
jgi:hypothetical protein